MIITAIVLIVLGFLIKYGKMYFLVAGYNTMSKEEKEKYDIEGIATLFRNIMFGMAFGILAGVLISYWIAKSEIGTYFFYGSISIGTIYLLIASNSKKYKNK